MSEQFGLWAFFVTLFGFLLYGAETLIMGRKPNRASWFVWSILSGVLLVSYRAEGAQATLPYAVADFLGYFCLWILATVVGSKAEWTCLEKACLILALLSIAAGVLSGSPLISILMVLFLDFVGTVPTFIDPRHEPKIAWPVFLAGAILNIMAVDSPEIGIVVVPLYFAVALAIMTIRVLTSKDANSAS